MSLTRRVVAIAFALVFLTASSLAQKNEVSGLIGRIFIPTQTIQGATFFNPNVHFGNGVSIEANYSRHLMGDGFWALRFEVPFIINFKTGLNTGANLIPKDYSAFFITPSARLHAFADTAVSPWVSFGGGYGRFNVSDELLYGGPNPGDSNNTGILQFGAGLDVRIKGPWSARLAARDFWTSVPNLNVQTNRDRQHNFWVGGGIAYRF